MSDRSINSADHVWQATARVLRRKRMQRRAIAAGSVLAPVLACAIWLIAALPPGRSTKTATVFATQAAPRPTASPQLAVFVRDGEEMRLELVAASDLGDDHPDFSLEPVVLAMPPWEITAD